MPSSSIQTSTRPGATVYSPYLAGTLRAPEATIPRLNRGPRKLIARRAADELTPGDIVNLGFGVSSGVASVLAEEGCYDRVVFSIEQGIVGGVPGVGLDSGTAVNAEAYIDEGSQFDLYDGGALDVACVAFGEVDAIGNVNVSKLAGRAVGPGGFINITQNAKKVVFCGTLTGGGLEVAIHDDRLEILKEGRYAKFVERVEHITFSAAQGRMAGRRDRLRHRARRVPSRRWQPPADRARSWHRARARCPRADGLPSIHRDLPQDHGLAAAARGRDGEHRRLRWRSVMRGGRRV